jgi:hypothetical protein
VRSLHPDHVTMHEGGPITSVARTLLDFAEVRPLRELERAIEQAERRHLFDLRAVDDVCARSAGRRGVRSVRQVLADFTAPPPTRSDFERDFLYLCRDAGLPPPAVNGELAGYEVDCVWRGERLSVELDSRRFHERRSAFEADRLRDAAVQLAIAQYA